MEWWSFIIAIVIPLGGSALVQFFVPPPDTEWYGHLKKPSWTPPAVVFPIVWISLYFVIGVASWLVYKAGGFEKQWLPLLLYAIQLLLNFAWTPIFFGARRVDLALVEIILLWIAIAATMIFFWRANAWAGLLFIPYIIWVTIATTLNAFIFYHNQSGRGLPEELTRKLDTA